MPGMYISKGGIVWIEETSREKSDNRGQLNDFQIERLGDKKKTSLHWGPQKNRHGPSLLSLSLSGFFQLEEKNLLKTLFTQ